MDRFGKAEARPLLPMERKDKALLVEMARRLAPYKNELVSRWRSSFASTSVQLPAMTDKLVAEMANKFVDALLDLGKGVDFDRYFDAMLGLGQEYVGRGIPYSSLIFAIHLYEETNLPFLAREFTPLDKLQEVLTAQDHLFHNVLALFSAAYYEGILQELQTRTDQLEARTAELEEEGQKRQEFISMVVHELRGPLTAMSGFTQLLARRIARGESCDPDITERIQSQIARLERLVGDLADVSLLGSGQFKIAPERCDLVTVARSVVEEQQLSTAHHRLILEATPRSIIGEWDSDRIAQAISNLVSNAIKYSPGGGEVKVSMGLQDGEAWIDVSDQGIGVAAQDIPQLFEPFSRPYRERKIKGTGLGLYITKGIVDAHGGRIWVDGQEGKGSTFHIALPLKRSCTVTSPTRSALGH